MFRNLLPLLGLTVVLAAGSFAQNTTQNQSGPNGGYRSTDLESGLASILLEKDDDIASGSVRPRVVGEKPRIIKISAERTSAIKTSAVKASVVVNIVFIEKIAFDALNQKRLEVGLEPLVWNTELEIVARLHSENMAEYQFFGHRDLDGKVVSDRAACAGVNKWRAIGENIAYNRGFKNPVAEAVAGWMDSAAHKRNLLDENWKESAVGVAVASDGSYYFTQVFLVKK